ncbi:MAG: response regulator, partial [Gemmatimonadetes bacterium]|nr:response regulator transcription factor [Gemmatimonadota bacterium]NIR80652.1 response regulator transcription factor [Gemmatimonadota bacterium]NIT89439.1 response regulator transcription factor [Gemmatimonadota bacterium]NIU33246.1 response regulator transcription factor [Gemmatimonadota bacterium]NIU37559.1 response regulator [Gemmatimonadota bacterium]
VTPLSGSPAKVRALICEDEPIAVRALRKYLADVEWVEVLGEAREGREAMRLIHKLEPDLVFLDVRMPRLDGVEVLETVTHRPAVVFTTAFDEYAVKAFELGAVDYLVKPFGRERLLECLGRVRVRLVGEGVAGERPGAGRPRGSVTRVFARKGEAIVPVPTAEIVRIDAETGGARIVTAEDAFSLSATLAEVEEMLDPEDFVRVHRSHVVNLKQVAAIERYDERRLRLELADGSSVVASRRGSAALRERIA